MKTSNKLTISDTSDPESLLGKTFVFDNEEYELVSIRGYGQAKIVYDIKNTKSGKIDYVLRVFRKKISRERFSQIEQNWQLIPEILPDVEVPKTHHFYIGDWPVQIQEHLAPPGSGYQVMDFFQAEEFFKKLSCDKDDIATIQKLYFAGNFKEALKLCDSMLEEYPLKPDYLAIKGGCLQALGQIDDAVETLRIAVEVQPGEARHYLNLAAAFLMKGQPSEAMATAYKAVVYSPDHPIVWERLFHMQIQLGRIGEAAESISKMKECSLDREKVQLAEATLKSLVAELAYIEKEVNTANEFYLKGEMQKAKDALEVIKRRAPYHVETWLLTGIIALHEKQYEDAVFQLGQALSLNVGHPEVLFYLGYAHFLNHDLKSAIALHFLWSHNFSKAVNRIKNMMEKERGTKEEPLVLERHTDIILMLNREKVLRQTEALKSIYSSLAEEETEFSERVRKIMVNLDIVSDFFKSIRQTSRNDSTHEALESD